MDEERAFEILEIPKTASSEDIENKFQDLVNQRHPDRGGNAEDLMELIEARRTALESQSGKSLTPYEEDAVPKIPNETYDQKKNKSEKTLDRIVRKHTSKYRRYKQILKIFTAFIGTLTFFRLISSFIPTVSDGPLILDEFAMYFTTFTLLLYIGTLGFLYWLINLKVKNIEVIVAEVEEVFDQKSNLIRMLSNLDMDLEDDYITEEELQIAIKDWTDTNNSSSWVESSLETSRNAFSLLSPNLELHSIANKIGPADFNRIFLRKCIEAGIIEEKVESEGDGQFSVKYYLTI